MLVAIVLALVLGSVTIGDSHIMPSALGDVFVTFSTIFGQFLSFSIPLIIIGLVTPAIADLGKGAGHWLGLTAALAYASTMFAGFLTYGVCAYFFPKEVLKTYFTIEMPPVVGVMTALLLSFVVGIGLSLVPRGVLRKGFIEFRAIITRLIENIIVPLLPLHIFGIFLNLTYTGEAVHIMRTLIRVVVIVLILEVVILLTQYFVAGAVGRVNPFKAIFTMLPAYLTALGTSSSAATIPLCATIYLAGSTSKIFAFAFAIVYTQGMTVTTTQWVGFIFMLGITMVAAPGVPGGAIMAATGILQSMLGFDDSAVALMIATYIALDSFGTATNVTGDGAIAIIMDRLTGGKLGPEGDSEHTRELAFDGMAYLHKVSVEGVVTPEELAESAALNGTTITESPRS